MKVVLLLIAVYSLIINQSLKNPDIASASPKSKQAIKIKNDNPPNQAFGNKNRESRENSPAMFTLYKNKIAVPDAEPYSIPSLSRELKPQNASYPFLGSLPINYRASHSLWMAQ